MGGFFSSRIPLRDCAALCRRLATSLNAGVDVRKVLGREADHGRGMALRRHMAAINEAVGEGQSLAEAVAPAGDYFPPLFHEMVEVGEQTGHQGEIFAQLAEHYENQVQLRRSFLASIVWPMFQLCVALAVVGFLIWISDMLGNDMLHFGLKGNSGLAIYLTIVAAAAATVYVMIRAANRGLVWVRPVQRAVMRVPVLGPALGTMALARLAWSMHLTMNAGMELRRALRLSLKSTANARYIDCTERIDATIAGGNSIYEAFCKVKCFPPDFLDTIEVGEHSGRLVESMAHLSRQYREQAQLAFTVLTKFAGFGVWALVAILLIFLIFRLYANYSNMINDLLK